MTWHYDISASDQYQVYQVLLLHDVCFFKKMSHFIKLLIQEVDSNNNVDADKKVKEYLKTRYILYYSLFQCI